MSENSQVQNFFYRKYKKYELPEKFVLENNNFSTLNPNLYQQFLREVSLNIKNKGILVYAGVGSGKTLISILMAKKMLDNDKVKRVIVLLPASLKNNFTSELKKVDVNFDSFHLYSYNSSVIIRDMPDFKDSLVIIDEIQNVVSMATNVSKIGVALYKALLQSNCKIIGLSATPVLNEAYEYAVLFNLLKPGSFVLDRNVFVNDFFRNGVQMTQEAKKFFYKKIKGLVSYYKGADENSDIFPIFEIKDEIVEINGIQKRIYKETEKEDIDKNKSNKKRFLLSEEDLNQILFNNKKIPNDFQIKLRMNVNNVKENYTQNDLENIGEYSAKFMRLLELISNSTGPIMVYSFFVENTLKPLKQILNLLNIKNYLWTGDTSQEERKIILNEFNKPENIYEKIVFLTSKAGSEGLTLKNVRQIHILEPHWNMVKIIQVFGRGIRMFSHINLPKKEQKVHIYLYKAKIKGDNNDETTLSVDYYIDKIAKKKYELLEEIENLIKESAFDCLLNKKQNKIMCFEEKIEEKNKQDSELSEVELRLLKAFNIN